MKTSRFVLPLAFLLVAPHGLFGDQVQSAGLQTFEKGRAAYYRGDLVEARRCFEQLLKTKPDFELARIHLAQVAAAEREQAKIPLSLKVAKTATIERMQWHESSVGAAVEAVAREIERAAGNSGKTSVRVASHLPDAVRDRNVSFSVSKVSPDHVLGAIGFAGGVRVSYVPEGLAVREAAVDEGTEAWDAGDLKQQTMETAAKKLILERFVMQEASVVDAMDYLQRKTAELSGGRLRPLFVVRYDAVPRGSVSLDLRNVSVYEAVRSVCLVSDLEESWFPWGAGADNQQTATAVSSPPVTGRAAKQPP